MKCIVTGGAGFIGSHLVDRLIERGHEVRIIDDLSSGRKENLNPKAEFYQADVCNFEEIKPLFEGMDYVFHLAAIPRVPVSIKDPVSTSRANVLGTISVFKAGTDTKVKRIVFASSSSVYGEQEKFPLKEDMEPRPISPYALQKFSGEQFGKMFFRLYGTEVVSLRYFNVYGPRIDFESDYSLVLGKLLRLKMQGKPLEIYGDGNQTRSFCYVGDIARANIKAMESKKIKGGEVINIAGSESCTINYFSQLVGGETRHLPPRQGDVYHARADLSLAKELLDWEPETTLKKGVEETQNWFQQTYGK